MRYMWWDLPALQACPAALIEVIITMSQKEAEDFERRQAEARRR